MFVELAVHELFAVVWNILKIILGVICYEYVLLFASHDFNIHLLV